MVMSKKLHPYSERLKRFIDETFPSQRAFAEDMGLSPQTINQSYLKDTPFPGAEFMHKLRLYGCDLNWLIIGSGLPPNPNKEEMELWVEYCSKQAVLWKERIDLELKFVEFHIAAEPTRPYKKDSKTKHRRKKR